MQIDARKCAMDACAHGRARALVSRHLDVQLSLFADSARLRSALPQPPGISLLRNSSPAGNRPAARSTNNFKLPPRTRQLRYFIQRSQPVPSRVAAGSVGNAASAVLGAIVPDLFGFDDGRCQVSSQEITRCGAVHFILASAFKHLIL